MNIYIYDMTIYIYIYIHIYIYIYICIYIYLSIYLSSIFTMYIFSDVGRAIFPRLFPAARLLGSQLHAQGLASASMGCSEKG